MLAQDSNREQERLPRIPAALFRALLPRAEREEVLGDLATEFGERARRDGSRSARLWCWRQVGGSVLSLVARSWWRGWSGFEPRANAMRPGGPSMEQWIMDARYATRRLVRRPLYATLAILTLALGIGGTTSIFGIARGALFDPLPFRNEEGIALFWMPLDWSQREFGYLRGRIPGFAEVAQYRPDDATLELGDGPAKLVPGIAASSELFSVLGVRPALGRTFEPGDDVRGAEAVVVLSHGLWQDLGGDRGIIGTRIRYDGIPRTVVGVMPRGFWFPTPAARVWVPQPLNVEDRSGNYALVGRVTPGYRIDNMSGPLAQLTKLLDAEFDYPAQWDKTRNPSVQSIRDAVVRPLRPALLATLAAMAIILIMACANVAALMLGQVEGRATELALRSALGANRRRLTGQLVAEALILGLASGICGAVLAAVSFKLLVNALPLGAWAETASLGWSVFVMAMVVAVGSALTISLVPTLSLWRGRLRDAMGSGRTGGVTGGRARLESSLVIAEVALAVLMAAGAGLVVRSVGKLYALDPGIDARGVGVVDVVLPSDLTTERREQILRETTAELRALPGVRSAAIVQRLPLRGSSWSSGIQVEGKPDLEETTTYVRLVSSDYFGTMGIAVTSGRGIVEADVSTVRADSAEGVVVINEALAKKYFPGEDPIGRRVSNGFGPGWVRVVGVVRDVAEGSLTDEPAPARYMPYTTISFIPVSQTFVFRTTGDGAPAALLRPVSDAIQRIAPRVAVQEATTAQRVFEAAMGPVRQIITLVGLLTTLALLLGAIGIYGVISHFVARRKRDWGIQIALGLRPSQVVSGVVRRGTSLVLIGVGVGLLAFVAFARLLESLLYGVGSTDPLAIGGAIAALLVVGVVAALVPAARASRTDPAIVLREH